MRRTLVLVGLLMLTTVGIGVSDQTGGDSAICLAPSSNDPPKREPEQPSDCESDRPAKKPDKQPFWERTWNDPISYFTLWLTILSGLTFVTAFAQAFFLYQTNKVSRDAANAAEKAAEAAKTAADASEAADRAILVFDGFLTTTKDPERHTGNFRCQYKVVNIGRTPAIITASWEGVVRKRYGQPVEQPLRIGCFAPVESKDTKQREFPCSISAEEWAEFDSGRLQLRAVAKIEYSDLFGGQWMIEAEFYYIRETGFVLWPGSWPPRRIAVDGARNQ